MHLFSHCRYTISYVVSSRSVLGSITSSIGVVGRHVSPPKPKSYGLTYFVSNFGDLERNKCKSFSQQASANDQERCEALDLCEGKVFE
jgi:hypothetical protein